MLQASLLSLASAFNFALGSVLLKRALQHSTPLVSALISISFTAAFIWILAALRGSLALGLLLTWKVLPFLLAGLVAPGVSRLVLFIGVHRLGVARSSAMVATSPLLSIVMATAVLGERPSLGLLLGAGAVVAGGVLLSYRGQTERRWRRRDLLFPLLAAAGFAFRDIITRWGLRDFHHPMLGVAAATAVSVSVIWCFAALQWKEPIRFHPVGTLFMALSGLFEGLATISMWAAFNIGEVSVVSPLVHAQPFFAIVLTLAFLRGIERVTWKVTIASALIVAGVAFVIRAAG